MFSQTWKKYLPVITILLKRSANETQYLSMNNTDFDRAAGGRKIKFSFTQLQVNNGKINTQVKLSPLARELGDILLENEVTRKIIANQQLEFSLNNDCQLCIVNHSTEENAEGVNAEEVNAEEETTEDEAEVEETVVASDSK